IELKYQVLAEFPDFFFCDPDLFPVAYGDEAERAIERFPEIQANAEEFEAILVHNGLSGQTMFSDQEKLLIYREHKKLAALPFSLAGDGYEFQLRSGREEAEGHLVTGSVDSQGSISIVMEEPTFLTCPICLAAGTRIETPSGPVRVESLRAGMLVWTLDEGGMRLARPLVRVGRTVVPETHQVIHILLEDGRELWVSPGHPTADGRSTGELRAGEGLDGGVVRSVEAVPYATGATYDLLPAGETGFYWANGILMGSTLRE
ncbi:MAG TPA: Hint domain-containing protein, partial [Anaerolineales bacterium]|nr:Hint domain-containing protein [Anaerolineales bacterium]